MAKLIKQEDKNIIPHPPMTVFYRHEWDDGGKTKVLSCRLPEIYDGSYFAWCLGSPVNRFKRLVLNFNSAYRIGQTGAQTYADYLEINAPVCTNLYLPYVFLRLYAKNVVLNFNNDKLTTFAYICAANPYNDCAIETCKITGTASANGGTMAFANCTRLYSLRIESLANCNLMTQMALYSIFDKPTVLHLRDLVVASPKTGAIGIGVASDLQTDAEVQEALAEISAKRLLTVRYNSVPYDLRQKVYGTE